jgi:hypothetical protein
MYGVGGQILVECPATCGAAAALRQHCAAAALSPDLAQAATACQVLTRILVHW